MVMSEWELPLCKGWSVTIYVSHYYPTADLIESDKKLQAWWTEVRTRGHEDKKDEPRSPVLKNQENLVQVMTTIIWVASAHRAAANFGQHMYGGYFSNHPTIARTDMPTEVMTDEMFDTETVLLRCFPSKVQATTVMAVLEVLSNHSPDEEYPGKTKEPSWEEDLVINNPFEQFARELRDFENIINKRNNDQTLRNRNGFHVIPYELLKPVSGPRVTGKDVILILANTKIPDNLEDVL
ncbi:Lipoxygenase, C-terminal [Dillenia turbinata]|uniref:Lipoxygenase, C-terminal n=1 Tax=Dillenia turbinata TaxID=194707 RepID=A0AAN8ZB52_9MAGN